MKLKRVVYDPASRRERYYLWAFTWRGRKHPHIRELFYRHPGEDFETHIGTAVSKYGGGWNFAPVGMSFVNGFRTLSDCAVFFIEHVVAAPFDRDGSVGYLEVSEDEKTWRRITMDESVPYGAYQRFVRVGPAFRLTGKEELDG